jgi:hypothetical protein
MVQFGKLEIVKGEAMTVHVLLVLPKLIVYNAQ